MAIPVISEIAAAMRKAGSRNSRSGITGSAACRAETSQAAPSATACRRADQEEDDRELEDRLAAEQVADLAVNGHHDSHRQQVGGDHPADIVQPVQVTEI